MGLLKPLGSGQGYLKAGFLGFGKSGKTYTAAIVACGLRQFFGDKGRIAFYDTEAGSEYLVDEIKNRSGVTPDGVKSRSFADLMTVTGELAADDILIVDSVTHPWRELCDSYLEKINRQRKSNGQRPRYKLEFQDWNPIKAEWSRFTEWYLNSPVHIIMCGRAGFEYDYEVNEETNRKDLVKTGVKMKTETETGFEPSLLVEFERAFVFEPKHALVRRATVIGDRFNVIDGLVADNPTFDTFLPHIQRLKPGAMNTVDASLKSTPETEDGDVDWAREKRTREILCEEAQGLIVEHYPGQSASDKKRKVELIAGAFHTRSWKAVENMPSELLRGGLERLKEMLGAKNAPPNDSPITKAQVEELKNLATSGDKAEALDAWLGANGYSGLSAIPAARFDEAKEACR